MCFKYTGKGKEKMQNKHKYRVQVYLGKELFEKLKEMSEFMGVPIATVTKIVLKTGFELTDMLEKSFKDGIKQ